MNENEIYKFINFPLLLNVILLFGFFFYHIRSDYNASNEYKLQNV